MPAAPLVPAPPAIGHRSGLSIDPRSRLGEACGGSHARLHRASPDFLAARRRARRPRSLFVPPGRPGLGRPSGAAPRSRAGGSGQRQERRVRAPGGEPPAGGKRHVPGDCPGRRPEGFEGALGSADRKRYETWRASDRPGWLFLDSVEEAKLDGIRLRTALRKVADATDGAEGAPIFSSRAASATGERATTSPSSGTRSRSGPKNLAKTARSLLARRLCVERGHAGRTRELEVPHGVEFFGVALPRLREDSTGLSPT
jgi:hypothetical protein